MTYNSNRRIVYCNEGAGRFVRRESNSGLSYDAAHGHQNGCNKFGLYLIVTTRSIAHPGGRACIRMFVDKLDVDTGQHMVTSNKMCKYLATHLVHDQ